MPSSAPATTQTPSYSPNTSPTTKPPTMPPTTDAPNISLTSTPSSFPTTPPKTIPPNISPTIGPPTRSPTTKPISSPTRHDVCPAGQETASGVACANPNGCPIGTNCHYYEHVCCQTLMTCPAALPTVDVVCRPDTVCSYGLHCTDGEC